MMWITCAQAWQMPNSKTYPQVDHMISGIHAMANAAAFRVQQAVFELYFEDIHSFRCP